MLLKGPKVSKVMLMVLSGLTAHAGVAAAADMAAHEGSAVKQVKESARRHKHAVVHNEWRQEMRPTRARSGWKRIDFSPSIFIAGSFIGSWPIKSNYGCQTLNFDPNDIRMYVDKTNRKMREQGEFSLGLSQLLVNWGRLEYGLAFSVLGTDRNNGIIWDQADPRFANHVYFNKISTQTVAFLLRSLWAINNQWSWYVGGRAGVGFNYAHDYRTYSLIDTEGPTPTLGDHLTTGFAGAVETGFEYAVLPQVSFGIGYRYDYLGKVNLGRACEQALLGSSLSHTAQRHGFEATVKWRAK